MAILRAKTTPQFLEPLNLRPESRYGNHCMPENIPICLHYKAIYPRKRAGGRWRVSGGSDMTWDMRSTEPILTSDDPCRGTLWQRCGRKQHPGFRNRSISPRIGDLVSSLCPEISLFALTNRQYIPENRLEPMPGLRVEITEDVIL